MKCPLNHPLQFSVVYNYEPAKTFHTCLDFRTVSHKLSPLFVCLNTDKQVSSSTPSTLGVGTFPGGNFSGILPDNILLIRIIY